MPTNKTQPVSDSVERFISNLDNKKRQQDSRELLKIMQDITGLEPVMWGSSIIGFGNYHYKYPSGREGDTVIVGFAPRKNALVLYSVVYYDQNLELSKKLGPHTTGKGCLYIKDLDKIDHDILRQMIKIAFEVKKKL